MMPFEAREQSEQHEYADGDEKRFGEQHPERTIRAERPPSRPGREDKADKQSDDEGTKSNEDKRKEQEAERRRRRRRPFVIGGGLVYSYFLSPQISFFKLAEIRIAQSVGIALLFVPINAAAFLTISKEDTGDASALFVMFRNVAGSIGISLSTAMVTERTQVRMAHLGSNLTPFDQGYVDLLARYTEPPVQLGVAQGQLGSTANGLVYQHLRSQAAIMGNADVFLGCAILAFVGVPLAFLLSGGKGKGGAAG